MSAPARTGTRRTERGLQLFGRVRRRAFLRSSFRRRPRSNVHMLLDGWASFCGTDLVARRLCMPRQRFSNTEPSINRIAIVRRAIANFRGRPRSQASGARNGAPGSLTSLSATPEGRSLPRPIFYPAPRASPGPRGFSFPVLLFFSFAISTARAGFSALPLAGEGRVKARGFELSWCGPLVFRFRSVDSKTGSRPVRLAGHPCLTIGRRDPARRPCAVHAAFPSVLRRVIEGFRSEIRKRKAEGGSRNVRGISIVSSSTLRGRRRVRACRFRCVAAR
jgi:hypothetical protein